MGAKLSSNAPEQQHQQPQRPQRLLHESKQPPELSAPLSGLELPSAAISAAFVAVDLEPTYPKPTCAPASLHFDDDVAAGAVPRATQLQVRRIEASRTGFAYRTTVRGAPPRGARAVAR